MRKIMEESPVDQEDPSSSIPLQCISKENTAWQDFTEKVPTTQNTRYLFLTVEYIQDVGNEVEFHNISPSISENGRISPFDPNLSSSGRYSPLYDTLVIPADGQSQYQNSLVVLPASKNSPQQISITVDGSQIGNQLIVDQKPFQNEGVSEDLKLNTDSSQMVINSDSNFEAQVNCEELGQNQEPGPGLGQKLIITTPTGVLLPQDTIVESATSTSSLLSTGNSFYQNGEESKIVEHSDFVTACNDSIQNGFPNSPTHQNTLLKRANNEKTKTLLGSSKYVLSEDSLKSETLLLADADQNSDLLMKNETLMEVDSYNLGRESYVGQEEANSYSTIEEHLNVCTIGKTDTEYLLPDAMAFVDADSSILQPNLEVFSPQVLDNDGLLLYDKSRLRSNKKHPAEHLGFEYWCEDCEFGMKCGRHEVKIVSDKPVLSRARATLPKELLAINKLNGSVDKEGVFARKTIMRRVQFGPVEGQLLKDWKEDENKDIDAVELLLEVKTGHLQKLDVSNEYVSNWMRFVRKATTIKEQNLILTQQGKSLYFITTRVIPPRQELKVGYSPRYAEKRKLQVLEDLSWHCFECAASFTSSKELQKHLDIHENQDGSESSGKKRIKSTATKGTTSINKKKGNNQGIQTEKVSNGRENECGSCHKIFPRTYSLKRHLQLVHPDEGKEDAEGLKNSKEKNQKDPATNTLFKKKHSSGAGSEWLCTHCNLTFDNPSVLNLHTLTHAAEDLESEAVLGLPSELSSVYHDGEFLVENGDVQCPQCTQEFPSKRELIDHVSTHGKMTFKKCCSNPSKPYKCEQCYKSFATDIRLQKHMLVHGAEETKPYQCSICLKRFLNNSALSCHVKTHDVKKSFDCPLCKKEFDQVFALKEHVKIHSSNGCYTCPHCGKVFDGYSVVRKHIRGFHSGHHHICKDCGKSCPTLDKLRMHSLKHSDHREFLCANCGKQFKRKDKLKEHMKRMHSVEREMKLMSMALRIPSAKERRFAPKLSPLAYDRYIYKCRTCMVGFKRRGMLVNHLAKRHPDVVPDTVPELNLPILKTTVDYFCQYCDKIYKSSSKRKAHILKNHPGAELPLSNRQKGGIPQIPGMPNPTFSKTVGSVKTNPHACEWCHKQYASKAKLLQHQRKKHASLMPQSQQVPRPCKNPSSPVGSKIIDNSTTTNQEEKWKGDENSLRNTERINTNEGNEVFILNGELSADIGGTHKKSFKALPESIPCELLQQAMTELSQSLSDYKLPFAGGQESLLKMIGLKEENPPAVQGTRTWSDFPLYPPR